MADVRNRNGEFVRPSIEATTRAAAGLAQRIPDDDDFRLSIVDAEGPGAYPISSWTYLLVAPDFRDCRRAEVLLDLIRWSLLEGEEHVVALNYAPLTMDVRVRALNALKRVTCGTDARPVLDPGTDFDRYLGATLETEIEADVPDA
jgi:phosphate transport system substrate-binding protein